MKIIANFTKAKKIALIILAILSFALFKAPTYLPTLSVSNMFLEILMLLAYGFFFWLVFEVLVGFFYVAIKSKIEKNISDKQFINIFRAVIIPINILLFGINKIILLINFFPFYIMLAVSLIVYFVMFLMVFLILKKYFFESEKLPKEFVSTFFSFAFVYLCVHCFMWGQL